MKQSHGPNAEPSPFRRLPKTGVLLGYVRKKVYFWKRVDAYILENLKLNSSVFVQLCWQQTWMLSSELFFGVCGENPGFRNDWIESTWIESNQKLGATSVRFIAQGFQSLLHLFWWMWSDRSNRFCSCPCSEIGAGGISYPIGTENFRGKYIQCDLLTLWAWFVAQNECWALAASNASCPDRRATLKGTELGRQRQAPHHGGTKDPLGRWVDVSGACSTCQLFRTDNNSLIFSVWERAEMWREYNAQWKKILIAGNGGGIRVVINLFAIWYPWIGRLGILA